jgi:hypothetical protein
MEAVIELEPMQVIGGHHELAEQGGSAEEADIARQSGMSTPTGIAHQAHGVHKRNNAPRSHPGAAFLHHLGFDVGSAAGYRYRRDLAV